MPRPSSLRRTFNLLVRPRAEWRAIGGEPEAGIAELIASHLFMLTTAAALAELVGRCVVGMPFELVTLRVPLTRGVAKLLLTVPACIGTTLLMGTVAAALAPTFDAAGRSLGAAAARMVVVYASTPVWVACLALAVPVPSSLRAAAPVALVLALGYAVWQLHVGLGALLDAKAHRGAFTSALTVLWLMVGGLVLGSVEALAGSLA